MQQKTKQLEATFNRLADEWETNRPRGVDLHELVEHPAYQEIISMGEDAVPLILERMQRKPGHWFPALNVITGADPVPVEGMGNLAGMTAAWLQWGREKGFRWD